MRLPIRSLSFVSIITMEIKFFYSAATATVAAATTFSGAVVAATSVPVAAVAFDRVLVGLVVVDVVAVVAVAGQVAATVAAAVALDRVLAGLVDVAASSCFFALDGCAVFSFSAFCASFFCRAYSVIFNDSALASSDL
jgi:hypothetical protein